MRLTSNSNTIKSPRRKGAGRARNHQRTAANVSSGREKRRGAVRLARTIDDPPPRSRVPTHNLGRIVRIECTANAMPARVSPFLFFLSSVAPFSAFSVFSTSSTMMSLQVILFPRCRGYVLSIIDAPDDWSRKRRELELHEMHWFQKGYSIIAYYYITWETYTFARMVGACRVSFHY